MSQPSFVFLTFSGAGEASADVPGGGDVNDLAKALNDSKVNDNEKSNTDGSVNKTENDVKNGTDGEEAKKKKKKNKSKSKSGVPGVPTQTDPPTVPIAELFPSGMSQNENFNLILFTF